MTEKTEVFERLKHMLYPYKASLTSMMDSTDGFSLDIPPAAGVKKGELFAAIMIKKNYVSFHLMPVYFHPELLKDISADLNKRMQGKSCFNFTKVEDNLLSELSTLVETSFRRYKSEKKIK